MSETLSIEQAAEKGIERLRLPAWANPFDHIKIDIIDGKPGPWIHLYAPFNKECNGHDPVDILHIMPGPPHIDIKADGYVAYTGPLPDSAEYKDEVSRFDGAG